MGPSRSSVASSGRPRGVVRLAAPADPEAGSRKIRAIKRLKVVNSFCRRPEPASMVLDVVRSSRRSSSAVRGRWRSRPLTLTTCTVRVTATTVSSLWGATSVPPRSSSTRERSGRRPSTRSSTTVAVSPRHGTGNRPQSRATCSRESVSASADLRGKRVDYSVVRSSSSARRSSSPVRLPSSALEGSAVRDQAPDRPRSLAEQQAAKRAVERTAPSGDVSRRSSASAPFC